MGTPRVAGPLTSGTVGQWPPATGQWWNERRGGDPKTDQVTQGADSALAGWQPKETASQLLQQGGTQISVGGITAQSGRTAKNPGVAAPLASAGCRGNCLRMVDGRRGKIVLPIFVYSRLRFLRESAAEGPAPRGGCWSAVSEKQEAEGR